MDMNKPMIDFKMDDVAHILGVTRATIYNRIRAGELPDGSMLDIVEAAIQLEEERVKEMRKRYSERAREKLVIGVS